VAIAQDVSASANSFSQFQFSVATLPVIAHYEFGTQSGRNVRNLNQLAKFFDPYGIAGTTTINQEWEIYPGGTYPGSFQSANWVFSPTSLDLTATIPAKGGLFQGGIDSAQITSQATYQPGVTGANTYAFEANIQVPGTQGMWSSFWFYTQNPMPGANDGSEIDVSEIAVENGQDAHDWASVIHGPGTGPVVYQRPGFRSCPWPGGCYNNGDLSAGFHLYQAVWNTKQISVFLDGTLLRTTNFKWTSPSPAQFIINLAVGSSNTTGLPGLQPTSLHEFPAKLRIEHLTVWGR
jgi:hypothetical protein